MLYRTFNKIKYVIVSIVYIDNIDNVKICILVILWYIIFFDLSAKKVLTGTKTFIYVAL